MKYVGIDVHSKASVWCALDESGRQVATGKSETTFPALQRLAEQLREDDEVVVGQEVGTQVYLVHDAVTAGGVPILSFNPAHFRMIAASRKKTDKRDAYWLAKALQTGLTPHPVYIPTGEVRELRQLLMRRRVIQRDKNRWHYRARALLRGTGVTLKMGGHYLRKNLDGLLENPEGMDTMLLDGLGLCQRQAEFLGEELAHVEAVLRTRAAGLAEVERLMTIPGVGVWAAISIYAAVGDIRRFRNAKALGAYSGLVPSVRQSGDVARMGGITKEGNKPLRTALVQSAHIVTSRCKGEDARPLQAVYERVKGTRGRRKIALVAVARHLLKIAYHVLRDGTVYDASQLRGPST